jgi:hypothetical protein
MPSHQEPRCSFTAAAAGACFCCHNSLLSTPPKFYLFFYKPFFWILQKFTLEE